MGKLDGKVAFVTGAARGQGRSHAVRLAAEGAAIIAVDICAQIDSVKYPLGTPEELAETVAQVEAEGGKIVALQADVRDEAALRTAFQDGTAELGPAAIVIANAGIAPMTRQEHPSIWADVIGVNLTGVMHTVEVALPSMIDRGEGGAIVLTGSTAGLTGIGGPTRGGLAYTASKHGLVGLMRSYANNLARHSIRVNSVHPAGVWTPMVVNDTMRDFLADEESRTGRSLANALPVDLLQPTDISNAIVWLVSDEARYVTGVALPVDAGFTNKR